MGDVRFARVYAQLKSTPDPAQALRSLSDEELIGALAVASTQDEPLLANVLATEAQNRARRARAISLHIGEGVYIADASGRIAFLNPAGARMLGWPRAEAIGRDEGELIGLADAQGRPLPDDGLPHVEVLRSGEPLSRDDCQFRRRDGTLFPVSVMAAPIRDDGDIDGVVVAFRDDAARRKAEAALRESEERYRLLADNATDIVSRATQDGRFLYVSPACRAILGYEPDELLGRSADSLIHPDDAASLARVPLSERGETWTVTYRACRKDGRFVWLESHARALGPPGGEAEILAVTRDVTERKLAEERLAQSQRHLDEAQHLAHLGSWQWSVRENAFTCSDELLRLLGLGPERLPLRAEHVLGLVFPHDRPHVERVSAQALWHPGPYSYEHRIVRPDGTVRHLECHADISVDEEGAPVLITGTALDVTDQKLAEARLRESEARYRLLTESGHDLLLSLTPEGRITYASRASRRVLGYGAEELLGRLAWDLVAPEDQPRVEREFAAIRHGVGMWEGALRLRCHDGALRWFEIRASVVEDPAGGPGEVIGSLRDVTARKEEERELRRAAQILERCGDPIIGLTLDGRVESWNAAAARIYGWSEDEARGRSLETLAPVVATVQLRALLERVSAGEGVAGVRSERVARDGRRLVVTLAMAPLHDEAGRVVGAVMFEHDVTQEHETLRATAERLRRVVTDAPVVCWAVDRDGTILLVEGRGLGSLGIRAEEMVGRSVHEAEFGEEVRRAFLRAFEGDPVSTRETHGGRTFDFRYAPIEDDAGIVVGVVTVGWDVTEQLAAEAEVERLRRRLAEAGLED